MKKNQNIFQRYEKKYLITTKQYSLLMDAIKNKVTADKYFKSKISNIYFDTPDFRLIRNSLEKPVYKEKLRLRSYASDSNVFIELKKKYKGIVYKRRIDMNYDCAFNYLYKNQDINVNTQIKKEVDYFFKFYKDIIPAMFIYYDRMSYYCNENSDIRITFDCNILWRNTDLTLKKGIYGNKLLSDNQMLMEIKTPHSIPLWLVHILDELQIYQTSFSKYGTAYRCLTENNKTEKGDDNCA